MLDQALSFKFDTTGSAFPADGVYANRNFSTMDFSQHRELRFLLHSDKASSDVGTDFVLKVGTESNYDKVIVPTNFDGWRLISLKMVDSNGDGIADTLQDVSDASYGVEVSQKRTSNGILNFQEISMILAGVQQQAGTSGNQGEVWLNVIHLADSITKDGTAYKGDVVVKMDGWGSAGAKYKYQDSNFETPLAVSKNQEVTQQEYFVKVDRVKEFPMQANLTKSTVTTPLITDSKDYNTVSLLDKGQVDRQSASVRGDFIKENLPKIGLEYTADQVKYDVMKRKDNAQTYGATLSHSVGSFKNISAAYHITDSTIDYDRQRHLESVNYYNTDENTQKMSVKATYQPNNSFSITPNYSLSKSKEDRTQYTAASQNDYSYPKALTQNTGFNSTWKISKWLAPSLSYNISTQENNNLNAKTLTASGTSVAVGIGEVKTINRNADGGVSLTLNGNEILPQNKLFHSFVISSSYRLQDADAWADVDSGFDSRKELWIRGSSFKDVGSYGYRKSLILRDTFTSSQRWSPLSQYNLGGAAAPLKTISLINNFNKTLQSNEQTGTSYDSTSMTLPDMTFSISDLEKFFYAGRWFSSSNLKLRYSRVEQTNTGTDEQYTTQYGGDLRFMLFNYFDTVLNYTRKESDKTDLRASTSLESVRDSDISAQTSFYVGAMRITPKLLYSSHDKWLVAGQISESTTTTTPSINFRWDFNIPRGIKLPFINKMYNATNRVIWNTTLTYADKKSPVEVKNNYKKFDVTTSFDYEMSQNLRFTLSGGLTLLNHAYVETEDYTAYNLAANMTVQF